MSHEVPEQFRLLCMLHNIGATKPEKARSIQEIYEWTAMETPSLKSHLQKLIELGYVQLIEAEGTGRYHLTPNGIRNVLTMYS